MGWMRRRWLPCSVALALCAAPAGADPLVREVVVQPPSAFTSPGAQISPFIYLNRCIGGCTVTGGSINDARNQRSTIPNPGTYVIQEFANYLGSTGANGNCRGGSHDTMACTGDPGCADTCNTVLGTCNANTAVACSNDTMCTGTCETADADWAAVVQCMKEVYSPYAVTVTDVQPPVGTSYDEAIVAGNPADIGEPSLDLGVAPLAADCSAQDNAMSFTFANHHPGEGMTRVLDICWTAAQEAAHVYGLDHEFSFVSAYPTNGNSACMDPMTYRTDCGGEKFFRNADAMCGEDKARTCRCGGTQNSHAKITTVFGAGQSIVPAPIAMLAATPNPRQGAAWPVFAQAGSKRGVARVELWLNGYPWASAPGGVFGTNGQADPQNYSLTAPASVPDGTIDVMIKAYDDLGIEGDSQPVTVQKGAPCTTAQTCLTGQKCENGRCFWDPPTGQLGDACPYPQFCTSGECSPTQDPICTQSCTVGAANACPSGYDCVQLSGTRGFCYPGGGGGGCCDSGGGTSPWPAAGLAALVLGLVTRRRARGAGERDVSC